LDREIAYQKEEIERRLRFYRGEHPAPEVSGKTVIVVDDGIATGYTFRAALESLRQRNPDRLVAAAPVAALDSAEMLKAFADEVVCLQTPVSFFAVGAWYQNFDQVSDEEAAAILHRNWSRWSWVTLFRAGRQSMNPKKPKEVVIPAGRVRLKAMFALPLQAKGVVAFAHGSGSGRLSPRNNFVAQALQEAGIATLLADLLEEEEALDRRNVFNITLLADRLLANAQWLRQLAETREMSIGYFGASTGAAAALQAVAREPDGVVAVVSRGGRPDLAMDYVHLVRSPTLLIVGGEDRSVIPLNELAYKKLICPKEMVVVPGATHLFEEPGALERVAELARDWFLKYFALGHEEKTS
jgi:putative phosphoribosyl transferase